jgi:Ca2+-transporting ATPase
MVCTLAVHVPIIDVSMLPVIFGLPLVLAPLHIAFLELVIDPACSIVFEAEAVLQGLWVVLLVVGLYAWLLAQGAATDVSRTASFVAMVTANAALIFPTRSRRGGWRILFTGLSAMPLWVLGATLAALLAVTNIPVLATAFGFALLAPSQWLMAFAVGAALLPVFQLTKEVLKLKRTKPQGVNHEALRRS